MGKHSRQLPVSAIIATKGRASSLSRTLDSLAEQDDSLREIIVVDASTDEHTRHVCERISGLEVFYTRALSLGAAVQRNQGVQMSSQPFVWFFDDDILFETGCLQRLWDGLSSDSRLGGVNAMIVNQRYQAPGFVSYLMFTLMNGRPERSFAGQVLGPAVNLLPEDRDDLPEIVPVEWLNTTCTMYQRESLPDPAFDSFFTGYSLMEDLALSLRVAQRGWKLANVRTAQVYHDSQPGEHKANAAEVASMELKNRYYVMTNVLQRTSLADHVRLALWELFSIASGCASSVGRRNLGSVLSGKWNAFRKLRVSRTR